MVTFSEKIGCIPIVDCHNGISSVAHLILDALRTVGFVYLRNVGISQQEVDEVFSVGDKFWSLPLEVKEKYRKPENMEADGYTGYIATNVEIFDYKNKCELREAFDVYLHDQHQNKRFPPESVVPKFKSVTTSFYRKCNKIGLEILTEIVRVSGFDENETFTKIHFLDESHETMTDLRLLHYPPLEPTDDPTVGRLGEHTDFNTLTLMFQDDAVGLEIMDQSGKYVPATSLRGAMLLNTGDMFQIWANDRIKANKHRVLINTDETKPSPERRSIAFFLHPERNEPIEPTIVEDGEVPKHSTMTNKEHFLKKTIGSFPQFAALQASS